MKLPHAVLVGALLFSLPAIADPYRVPVTDPAKLAALGLPADATNIWQLVDPDAAPAAVERNLVGGIPSIDGNSYSVTGDDFSMVSSVFAYDTDGNSVLYCPLGSGGNTASAVVHLPDGHRLAYLDFWGSDDSTTETMTAYLFETCMADDSDTTGYQTLLAQVASAAVPGDAPGDFFQDVSIPEYYADPQRCTYTVNMVLSTGICEGADLVMYKVRVTWE